LGAFVAIIVDVVVVVDVQAVLLRRSSLASVDVFCWVKSFSSNNNCVSSLNNGFISNGCTFKSDC
jgi:hypothetical protein